jgi:DNA-binding NarL/FixJ family response regulator
MRTSVKIAVSDPLPIFRRGVMAVLGDAGFEPRTPEELITWIREEQRPVVLLTLLSSDDWKLLAQLREARADITVIAVLADTSIRTHVQALLSGAVTAVARGAPPEIIREVFEKAIAGRSVLPVDVVRALTTSQQPPEEDEHVPSVQEISWLRELALGTTVAQLADRAGYSERAMFRLLRALYLRIGARNRTEALMLAQDRGWL